MSHTTTIDLQIKDREALIEVLKELGLSYSEGSFRLYSTVEKGLGINLPGWEYPAVVREDGSVAIDNYNGRWGDIKELNRVKSYYTAKVAEKKMRKKGYKMIKKEKNGKLQIRLIK